MNVSSTPISDCFVIQPKVIEDHRGYFFESFNKDKFFDATGIQIKIVQENQSKSGRGVLRGLHFQSGAHAQSKIVRALTGEVLDVIVDLRESSPSFGKHFKIKLSEANKSQVYIPKGCAHGFLILSEEAEFFYGIDVGYSPDSESGIKFNDPFFAIDWGISESEVILSERDKNWEPFNSKRKYFD